MKKWRNEKYIRMIKKWTLYLQLKKRNNNFILLVNNAVQCISSYITLSIWPFPVVRNTEVIPFSTATLSRSCLACSLATRELPTRYSFTLCKITQVLTLLLTSFSVVLSSPSSVSTKPSSSNQKKPHHNHQLYIIKHLPKRCHFWSIT